MVADVWKSRDEALFDVLHAVLPKSTHDLLIKAWRDRLPELNRAALTEGVDG
jgi:hypothetical protein